MKHIIMLCPFSEYLLMVMHTFSVNKYIIIIEKLHLRLMVKVLRSGISIVDPGLLYISNHI